MHLLCLDRQTCKTKISPQIQIDTGCAYLVEWLEGWLYTTQAIPSGAKVLD